MEDVVVGSVKLESDYGDQDNTKMEDSDSSDTLSLDLSLEPSLDTETKDRPDKTRESSEHEQQGPNNDVDELTEIKIEPEDNNESAEFQEHADRIDFGQAPGTAAGAGGATSPAPVAKTEASASK